MARLIDADELRKDFEERQKQSVSGEQYADCFLNNAQELSTEWWCVDDALDNALTIDAVPVVHARWVHGVTLGHEWRKCSACLVSQDIFGCFTYCPNCGAKMDGGAEG